MPSQIHYRIFGNAATIAMHFVNGGIMLSSLTDRTLMKDPQLQELASMQTRFITIWNICFQVAYAILALTCDISTVLEKDYLIPKWVKKFRDLFFTTIVFPGTLMVFTLFWPFYLYDREIVFPAFIDKVFSQNSNYIMHIAIVPVVLWELAFQPRTKPKSHKNNLIIVIAYYVIYNSFIIYTYHQKGIWPYPLMKMAYGTIYNVFLHIYLFSVCISCYCVQWPLVSQLWGTKNKKNKRK